MIRELFEAARVGAREARRHFKLECWSAPRRREAPGEIYVWPAQLDAAELQQVGLRLGLCVHWPDTVWSAEPRRTLWRLTIDPHNPPAGGGVSEPRARAGVAVCVNDDHVRDVVVLEPIVA